MSIPSGHRYPVKRSFTKKVRSEFDEKEKEMSLFARRDLPRLIESNGEHSELSHYKFNVMSTEEIERYSVWPGQACSYMVGKVTLLKLRAEARATLGQKFDVRKFHDAVLLSGSMPLTVLERHVREWVATQV